MIGILLFVIIVLFALGEILACVTKHKTLGRILETIGVFIAAAAGFIVGVFFILFTNPYADLYLYIFIVFILALTAVVICKIWNVLHKKAVRIPALCVISACIVSFGAVFGYQMYTDSIPEMKERSDLLIEYAPYYSKTRAVTLPEEASLTFKMTENPPRMDGATALFPIYSAFAKAVYPKSAIDDAVNEDGMYFRGTPYLRCSTTAQAYDNIIAGEADIIFVAGPSEKQETDAKENNVELVYTPIGKEAFVFFVNAKNPVDNMELDQIKKIYSGKITNWKELGIKGYGKIRAFQRDSGSGSQTALEKLMQGENLIIPPEENVIDGMGGIINRTADYKNYKNALGYSFRFYSSEMVSNNQIKLLKINGVFPDIENIENGSYPICSQFYAVTRADASENTKRLLDWIKSPQGRYIIEKTGYTALD